MPKIDNYLLRLLQAHNRERAPFCGGDLHPDLGGLLAAPSSSSLSSAIYPGTRPSPVALPAAGEGRDRRRPLPRPLLAPPPPYSVSSRSCVFLCNPFDLETARCVWDGSNFRYLLLSSYGTCIRRLSASAAHLQQLLQVLVLPRPALSLRPAALPTLFERPPLDPPQPAQFCGGAAVIVPGGRDTCFAAAILLLGPI